MTKTQPNAKPHTTSANDKAILLLADDIAWFRSELSHQLLKNHGIRSLQAAHGLAAIRALEKNPQIIAICADYRFDNGGMDGIMLLAAVKKRWPHVKRMLLSAYIEDWMEDYGFANGFSVRDKALPLAKLAESIGEWLE